MSGLIKRHALTAVVLLVGCGLTLYAVVSAVAVCNGAAPIMGDDGTLVGPLLQAGQVQVRWMLGMVGEEWIHSLLSSAVLKPRLPSCMVNQVTLAPIIGSICSGIGGAFVLWRFRSLAVAAVLIMPLWLRFTYGFIEIYPFVAWGWLAALAWLAETHIQDRASLSIGIVCALLVAAHEEFIPIAALLLLVRRSWSAVGWSAVWFVVIITCCSGSMPAYLGKLYESTAWNLGEVPDKGWGYPGWKFPHMEHALAGWPFWEPGYAFSWEHIKDELGVWLYEAGVWAPLLAVGGVIATVLQQRDDRWWWSVLLRCWCTFFVFEGLAQRPLWDGPDIWWQSQIAWTFLSVDAMTTYWWERTT